MLAPCKTVTGTVDAVQQEPDGDYHIALRLDGPYANLTNAANATAQHGDLVLEIVPADEPGCTPGTPPRPAHGTYDYGICTGANLAAPRPGQHVTVTGPYVLDRDHGWTEIHPVWAWTATGASTAQVPPASDFQLSEDDGADASDAAGAGASATASVSPSAAPPTPSPTAPPAPPSPAAPPSTSPPAASPGSPSASVPSDVTAVCADGTYSYSQHRSGTCSHHGGVAQWVNRPAV